MIALAAACSGGRRDAAGGYAGSSACADCHASEHARWQASHHAAAMAPIDAADGVAAAPVELALSDASTLRLASTGGGLDITVTDAGGSPRRYVPALQLGRDPIMQPLVAADGGVLRPLPVGFDVVRREWFDVFADEPRPVDDWGHWTNRGATANVQCLFCHTTGYERGYDRTSDVYRSRWVEMGVGCEGCHGPGAAHVRLRKAGASAAGDTYAAPRGAAALETCAPCHARRREIASGFVPGEPFLDHFEPELLDGDVYHPDGQLRAESYEWASFLQSRMHARGVGCGDCHDPHAGTLMAEGDALCLRCHDAGLAEPSHTHHASGSAGAACVACHMPTTVYMVRDPRRDHSFPIPDPVLTETLGVPSACDRCHAAEGAMWATARMRDWNVGDAPARRERASGRRALAAAFAAGRRGERASLPVLVTCVRAGCDPVRRASALRLLTPFRGEAGVTEAVTTATDDPDALVRWGAVSTLAEWVAPDADVAAVLTRAARDPIRAVRLQAAWGLRTAAASVGPSDAATVAAVLGEWQQAMAAQADHPEVLHSLGVFHADRDERPAAAAAYRGALALAPDSVPARYNLALLLSAGGDAAGAETELARVRTLAPEFAAGAYSHALLLGQRGAWSEAVRELEACLRSDPLHPGALYDLGLAYVRAGRNDVALRVLEAALEYPGARTEALRGLVAVSLETGDRDEARRWARVAADDPVLARDPRVQGLLADKTGG